MSPLTSVVGCVGFCWCGCVLGLRFLFVRVVGMMMVGVMMTDSADNLNPDVPLPDVGDSLAPTREQISKGHVGNGSHEPFTPELAKTIQAERRKHKQELKKVEKAGEIARAKAYQEGMTEGLADSQKLTLGLVKLGNDILARLEESDDPLDKKLTGKLLDTLKLANNANRDIPDRAIGKPKTVAEVKSEHKLIGLLTGRFEHAVGE